MVQCHSEGYPKADHLISRGVAGRAKRLRVAARLLCPAERTREREREQQNEIEKRETERTEKLKGRKVHR